MPKIVFVENDGTVLDECSYEDELADARKEFPRDTSECHREMAREAMVDAAREMIMKNC